MKTGPRHVEYLTTSEFVYGILKYTVSNGKLQKKSLNEEFNQKGVFEYGGKSVVIL